MSIIASVSGGVGCSQLPHPSICVAYPLTMPSFSSFTPSNLYLSTIAGVNGPLVILESEDMLRRSFNVSVKVIDSSPKVLPEA